MNPANTPYPRSKTDSGGSGAAAPALPLPAPAARLGGHGICPAPGLAPPQRPRRGALPGRRGAAPGGRRRAAPPTAGWGHPSPPALPRQQHTHYHHHSRPPASGTLARPSVARAGRARRHFRKSFCCVGLSAPGEPSALPQRLPSAVPAGRYRCSSPPRRERLSSFKPEGGGDKHRLPAFLQSTTGSDRGCQPQTSGHLNHLLSQRCCIRRILLSPVDQTWSCSLAEIAVPEDQV